MRSFSRRVSFVEARRIWSLASRAAVWIARKYRPDALVLQDADPIARDTIGSAWAGARRSLTARLTAL